MLGTDFSSTLGKWYKSLKSNCQLQNFLIATFSIHIQHMHVKYTVCVQHLCICLRIGTQVYTMHKPLSKECIHFGFQIFARRGELKHPHKFWWFSGSKQYCSRKLQFNPFPDTQDGQHSQRHIYRLQNTNLIPTFYILKALEIFSAFIPDSHICIFKTLSISVMFCFKINCWTWIQIKCIHLTQFWVSGPQKGK